MVNTCIARCCENKQKTHLSTIFHRIPKHQHRRSLWLAALGIPSTTPEEKINQYRVCEEHFKPEDYDQIMVPASAKMTLRLKNTAVPSVFETEPEKSSEQLLVRGEAGAGNGNWDATGGMDQITVVRIDDTHIAGEQVNPGGTVCYEMECTIPTEEVVAEDDEEEDNVFVIEYSNPEEEGESYQFTMSVDRSVPAKKPTVKHPVVSEHTREPLPVMPKPRTQVRRKPKVHEEEEEEEEQQQQEVKVERKRRMLNREEANSSVKEMNESERTLKCPLCPSPGKFFRRASGLAVHLKHMHHKEGNKSFFCITCKQTVRSQVELDAHTRRHAIKEAVFTCLLCTTDDAEKTTGYRGTRLSLKSHLKTEHPGVIPRCDICNRGFKTLDTYLSDQFRHVGVSPYYCAECKIYEMTERGLVLHMKNDEKKKKKMQQQQPESGENQPQAGGDNSATDDSDF